MRRVPMLALLACLASVAVAACGENATDAATVPPNSPDPTATVAGATGFPVGGASATALASHRLAPASAYPTGIDGALLYLQSYENDLIGGRYEAAWSMLAPGYQKTVGTFDAYETDRTAFMNIAGKSYTATANPTDVEPLADLAKGKPFASDIDQKRAVVLSVQWPSLVKQGTPPEVWIVNPAAGLGWELFRIR